jgi:homocysteine S-methyltransferase
MVNPKKLKYPIILDGGLSNVLEAQGCDLNHKLWSAKMIINNPEAIVKTHLSYLEAGAACITTSSYQATVAGFMDLGATKSEAEKLLLLSVALAEEARSTFLNQNKNNDPIYIAASIGPYGAFLADGSEYKGKYSLSEEALESFHLKRIKVLETSNADFLAFETIPSLVEIKILSKILMKSTKSSWVSFSCKDAHHLNDGEKISDAAKLLAHHPTVFAIGVNCTAPQYISEIIQTLKTSAPDKRIIVYPNSGEVYDVNTKSWSGISDPDVFQKMAIEWLESGADILGGCCRIGPDHIRKINTVINS